MQYQLKELFDNLTITLTELKRRSGISDVTLISIRNGHSARRSTINTLLQTFSEIYGVKLTLKNVDGIIIQGKPVTRPSSVAKQEPVQPVSTRTYDGSSQTGVAQNRNIAPSEGDMLLNDFAKMSGIPIRTLCNWKDASPPKIEVTSHKRDTGGGFEYFISPEQQEKALELRKRYPGKRK
jgi:predicted transcriptional regulator